MGRPDVSEPIDGPGLQASSSASCTPHGERVEQGQLPRAPLARPGHPAYADVRSRSRALVVESFPDRVLWGTDWPHPNMKSHMPDDGDLVDVIPHNRAGPTDLQQAPAGRQPSTRLYWEA